MKKMKCPPTQPGQTFVVSFSSEVAGGSFVPPLCGSVLDTFGIYCPRHSFCLSPISDIKNH